MEKMYDVAVLGGGPGGYEAAIRCAQYGLKTALIEGAELGGTCLNRGCIPTKALLHGAEVFEQSEGAAKFGVITGPVALEYAKLAAHKDAVVAKLRNGIAALEKAHKVDVIEGFGKLTDKNTIDVAGKAVKAEKIILATGSMPARPPIPGLEGKNVGHERRNPGHDPVPRELCHHRRRGDRHRIRHPVRHPSGKK